MLNALGKRDTLRAFKSAIIFGAFGARSSEGDLRRLHRALPIRRHQWLTFGRSGHQPVLLFAEVIPA